MDKTLDKLSVLEAYKPLLVENVQVLCKDGKLVIPQELQQQAVQWYHHYLQYPGTTCLEETLLAAIYWKGLRHSVRTFVKNCHKGQVNKRRQCKYSKLPTKLVVSNPWEVLCLDLIGPYTLKGKHGIEIDFMCAAMIDPATCWFEIVELPVTEYNSVTPKVNNIWFSRYPRCQVIIYENGSESKLNFKTLCDSYGIKRKPTRIKNPQANAILERMHQVIMTMLCIAELDMANTVAPSDIADFLTDTA
eukprot:CCRYP_009931-RA/>CCRYP_009931-RA protein AED:0.20 eAED:0.24 QI:0/0/0/1/0/0/2/0/246